MDLPDVNVWVALASGNHSHHARAMKFWNEESASQLAMCHHTALGMLRVLSTRHTLESLPLSVADAWNAYQAWRNDKAVGFLQQPLTCEGSLGTFVRAGLVTNRLWSDAYLAAFAKSAGLRLVTFDRDFLRFPGLDLLLLEA